MAIWQFDLSFVPRGSARGDSRRGPGLFSIPQFLAPQVHAWLCLRMGSPSRACRGWLVFGMERGDRVDLRYRLDGGSRLRACIDVRMGGASYFCGEVCKLAGLLDCDFFSAELGRRIEAAPCAVQDAVKASRATAFLSDPESFLEKLFLERLAHGGSAAGQR